MDTNNLQVIAIIISSVAILVSSLSLWRTHYSRFNPSAIGGPLKLRIFKLKSGNDRWFLPVIQLHFAITNIGARPGLVKNVRIRAIYPGIGSILRPAYEDFDWIGSVNLGKFVSHLPDYFKGLEEALIENDDPFIILPKETSSKEAIFSRRWDSPVIYPMKLKLQYYTGPIRRWRTATTWYIYLDENDWIEAVEKNSIIEFPANNVPQTKSTSYPYNLHDYTESEFELPNKGFGKKPKYIHHGHGDKGHHWRH
jgi:hypothetical protein